MIDLFREGELSYPVQFESESQVRQFQFVLVRAYTIMYCVSGLNILHWKFVGQPDSVTIQNNCREQLFFFLHFTGASFANDHHTANNDLCNSQLIFVHIGGWSSVSLFFRLQIHEAIIIYDIFLIFSWVVFLFSLCKEKFQEVSSLDSQ